MLATASGIDVAKGAPGQTRTAAHGSGARAAPL